MLILVTTVSALLMANFVDEAITYQLDLTKNRTVPEQRQRYPGAAVGTFLVVRHYDLPLSIAKTEVRDEIGTHVTMELTVLNTGKEVYRLPASMDAQRVEADGNKGRKVLQFQLDKDGTDNKQVLSAVVEDTDGSLSIPSSFVELSPGQSILIKLKVKRSLFEPQSRSEAWLGAFSLAEWTIDDNTFTISRISKEVIGPRLSCKLSDANNLVCQ